MKHPVYIYVCVCVYVCISSPYSVSYSDTKQDMRYTFDVTMWLIRVNVPAVEKNQWVPLHRCQQCNKY